MAHVCDPTVLEEVGPTSRESSAPWAVVHGNDPILAEVVPKHLEADFSREGRCNEEGSFESNEEEDSDFFFATGVADDGTEEAGVIFGATPTQDFLAVLFLEKAACYHCVDFEASVQDDHFWGLLGVLCGDWEIYAKRPFHEDWEPFQRDHHEVILTY